MSASDRILRAAATMVSAAVISAGMAIGAPGGTAAAGTGVAGTGVTGPEAGEQLALFGGSRDEAAIGRQEHPRVLAEFGGEYDNEKLTRYVSSLGQLLASASGMPQLEWHFTVLDSPIVNAFALPGGYVYISRGLLALADDEAQLAAVLGHEIGHVTARHGMRRQDTAVATQLGVLAAGLLGRAALGTDAIGQVAGVIGQGYLAGYSRDQEYEADVAGVRYSSRVGFDPGGMSEFLRKMQWETELAAKVRGQQARAPSYLDTHPPTPERASRAWAQSQGVTVSDPMRGRDVFLNMIDGMTWGDSPAQGFVRDRVFIHPELRIRFEVPQGFRLNNMPQQVVAEGPNGAGLVFDTDQRGGVSMTQYIQGTWAPRVQLSGLERINVNGREGATATARGSTRDGRTVDVRLVAVRWDGDRIYRMRFVTPTDRTAAMSEDLRRTTYSLRTPTDAELAEARPHRLRIHTVQRGETIDSLAQRMVDTDGGHARDRFMLLNNLEQGQQLQAGSRVKIVTRD